MTPLDFRDTVTRKLGDMAEVYDRKPPGDAALRVWWEALQAMSVNDVLEALADWGRSKSKMPTPAEVYAMANESGIQRRERKAAEEKANAEADVRTTFRFMAATSIGRRALEQIRETLLRHASDPVEPRAWAHRILDRYVDGEIVPDLSLRCACEATGRSVDEMRRLKAAA